MRDDLLTALAGEKDVTNAFILTHNIDFVFLQTMVLSALRRCGNPALTIFADSDCAAQSFAIQRPLLDGLGSRYRVVPIRMEPGFVFHPKAVLLSGPDRATLYVGSGNLTFGGWRENAEVWSRFSVAEDGLKVFDEAREYLAKVLTRVPLPDVVSAELQDAFDPKTKTWLASDVIGEPALIGRAGGGEPPLLDTLVEALSPTDCDAVYICAPYFDPIGEALASLCDRLSSRRSVLLHPALGATLTAGAWKRSADRLERRPSELLHNSADGPQRSAFVHAKFYAAVRGDDAVIVQGSANCSRAALTMDGRRGNAELMTVIRTSAESFQQSWLDPLRLVETAPDLPEEIPEALDEAEPLPLLRILAARFDDGVILVGYEPRSTVITSCSVDGVPVAIAQAHAGSLSIHFAGTPKSLQVVGTIDGTEIAAVPHWVDNERSLRTTARGRTLEDTIRRHAGNERWGCGAWIELLQAFGQHLAYTPARAGQAFVPRPRADADDSLVRHDYEAIFARSYSASALSDAIKDRLQPDGARQDSIQKLLLRWLGVGQDSDEEPNGPERKKTDAGDESELGEGDLPEKRPEKKLSPSAIPPSERDALKLRRVLEEVEAAITVPAFLELRPPDLLAVDLKMISALLRIALREGWLNSKEFFDVTQRLWAVLFLTSERDPGAGWLEVRHREAPTSEAFEAALRSPQLSAALIAWMMAGAEAPPSVQKARFMLARAVAAARLPWLWYGGDLSEIAGELAALMSAGEGVTQASDASQWATQWREGLEQGAALRKLEAVLAGQDHAALRVMMSNDEVRAGDLLWQGKAGFCVAAASGRRDAAEKIEVLKLQSGAATSAFVGSFIIPVRSLLLTGPLSESLQAADQVTLGSLLTGVSKNCGYRVAATDPRPPL